MSMGSTNIFSEMIDNRELLESQYDVLAGRWPESYNEMILVLSDSDGMTDYMAYALGLRDQEELEDMMTQVMQGNEVEDPDNPMTWTYDDLMSLSFTLINAGDTYKYNSDYDIWEDMSEDQEYMQNLMSQGEKLTIVGIVCPKAGVAASALTPGVAYTSDLTEHVMENAEKSQIVQQQLQQPDLDVFTGRTFEELENEEGAGLDFNDMISVDTEALSSAFGMDVDEDDMNEMVQSYMSDISSSITADTKPAETAFTDTLSNMLSEMLTDYWDENGGGSGIATISAGDVNGVVSSYLESAGAQSLMSQLEKDYGVPVSVFTQTYSQLLSGIVSGYITTASGDGGSAPLTPEIISALIESVSSNQGVLAVAQVMGKSMTEAAMQTTILTKVGQMSQELITSIAGSFNVDPEQIASAFNFELSEDELSRLMDAFSSQGNERSLESNLSTLGYADRDNPYSISVYLVDFTAKEHFIDFIENYNETVEAQGNEELVISYTDITGILISSVKTVVDSISYVLIAFVAISLIVSSIMIGVITLISVQERTKEIGILRALGASKRNVSSMFNAETGIIGFASGVLGIVITYLLCIPIDMILHSVTGISNLSTHLPVVVAGVLVVISVLLTLISGIIPSRSAAKKDPVEALRTE